MLVCTRLVWRSVLAPQGPFVSLKCLLNEPVFPLAAQSHLEKEHNAMSVSVCYRHSRPRSQPVFIVFSGPFYPFSVGKVINLPPGSGAVHP